MCFNSGIDDRERGNGRFLALGIGLVLGSAAAFCLVGCKTTTGPGPTTQRAQALGDSIAVRTERIVEAAEAAEVKAPAVKPEVSTIIVEARGQTQDGSALVADNQALSRANTRLVQERDEAITKEHQTKADGEKKLADVKAEADARWQKEHDANKWLGWKTRTYLWLTVGLLGLGVVLQVVAPLGQLLGPIGGIVSNLISLCGHALTGFVSIVFGWVDKLIAWVQAKVQARTQPKEAKERVTFDNV